MPAETINCSIINIQESTSNIIPNQKSCVYNNTELAINVSFPIYIIAFMSFISWFEFVIFGGIGLASLPLDLIYNFKTRPRKLSESQIENQKRKIEIITYSLKVLAGEVKALEDKGARTKNSNFIFYLSF